MNNTEIAEKLKARIEAINSEKADSTAAHNLRITKLNVEVETTQKILNDLEPSEEVAAPAVASTTKPAVKRNAPAKPAAAATPAVASTTKPAATEAAPATATVKKLHKPTVAGGAPATTGKKAKVVATFAEATTMPEKIYFVLSQIGKGSNKAILDKMGEYQAVDANVTAMVRQATSKAKIEGLLNAVGKEGLAHVYALAN